MLSRVDLHIHTTASDGSSSPSETVCRAKGAGLSAIAITDHDTVSGYAEAAEAGKENGIEVIPGIELSTRFDGPFHVLGYFIDCENEELNRVLSQIVEDRDIRNEQIISKMRSDGIGITYDRMKERFGNVIGRPHIAEILVENGICRDVSDAFEHFVGKGMRYWFPRTTIPPERCIELILHAGGIPVIAHPFEYKYRQKSLPELIEFSIDHGAAGIECRHSSHTPGQMAYLELLAGEYGLLKTGGSDYHGDIKPDIKIGTGTGFVSVPSSWLERLKEYHAERTCID